MDYIRNTIRNIDQDLLIEARVLALQSEQTLGQIVTDALEFYLADQFDWGDSTDEAVIEN